MTYAGEATCGKSLLCHTRTLQLLIVLLFFVLSTGLAFGQQLAWAKSAGGSASASGQAIAADAAGNSYVTGFFSGTAAFGPAGEGQTMLTSAGDLDIFVAKYDSTGALVWAKSAGGTGSDIGYGIAVDSAGNSYVTGYYSGRATFGGDKILPGVGLEDIFVAKYDSMGNLVWVQSAGGESSDEGHGIAVDADGNSYVTGYFFGASTFGEIDMPGTVTLMSSGGADIFVAKYDGSGKLLWAKSAGGSNNDFGQGIALDGNGNSYVTGSFNDTATFDPDESITLTGAGNDDIFVAKYDGSGTLQWARSAGGTAGDVGNGIAVDAAGNSYVTGFFSVTATFGAGESHQTVLTAAGEFAFFVAKYDGSGTLQWADSAGGTSDVSGQGIAVDPGGNCYVTGFFSDAVTFGMGDPNQTVLTSTGTANIFVAAYDGSGTLRWAKRAGGTASDVGNGIAVDADANSYVTGSFSGTATFGPGEVNETILTSVSGALDIFVARYNNLGDDAGPITSNVLADPNPVALDTSTNLSAHIDDSTTGGSNIASADFEIRDSDGNVVYSGTGNNGQCPMPVNACPVDGFGNPQPAPAFDAVAEDIAAVVPSHTLESGVYTICVRGADAAGNVGDFTCSYLVAYDPSGSFVTGGGWIQSDPGFCSLNALCAAAGGKANFAFFSKYKKGANVPDGQTQFDFQAGNLHFHSATYQWLVVAGPQAQFKGSGTINGSGDYGFLLTARDSAIQGGSAEDTFRIKIWETATGNIVYDNGSNQPIGGGSIVIHK